MDRVFFEQLELPEAKYNLDVGSGTHGEQIGRKLMGVERILQEEKPDIVLVEGDTNIRTRNFKFTDAFYQVGGRYLEILEEIRKVRNRR